MVCLGLRCAVAVVSQHLLSLCFSRVVAACADPKLISVHGARRLDSRVPLRGQPIARLRIVASLTSLCPLHLFVPLQAQEPVLNAGVRRGRKEAAYVIRAASPSQFKCCCPLLLTSLWPWAGNAVDFLTRAVMSCRRLRFSAMKLALAMLRVIRLSRLHQYSELADFTWSFASTDRAVESPFDATFPLDTFYYIVEVCLENNFPCARLVHKLAFMICPPLTHFNGIGA